MHELGVVFHIADSVVKVAEENQARKVHSVTLEIGEVSTIIPDYLIDVWNWNCKRVPLLEGCALNVEQIHAVTHCDGCGKDYDGQVEYATVNLSLREVYRLSNTEEPAGSFGARLGTALSSGWQGFLGGLQDIALALAYSWVWVLLLAALAAGGIRLFRRLRARHPATLPKLRKKLGAEDPRDTGSKEG